MLNLQSFHPPLKCVAPATARCQVGRQAEFTGRVLKTSWRKERFNALE